MRSRACMALGREAATDAGEYRNRRRGIQKETEGKYRHRRREYRKLRGNKRKKANGRKNSSIVFVRKTQKNRK